MSQASLAWTPPLVRFLKAILRLPAFLLFDFYSHSQTIRVPVITKKALRTFSTPRITTALVQVGRPGLDGSLPGELQIYSATLRFTAHLTGLRWLMYYHRIISFFLFCGVFFTISLLTALVLWVAAGYIWTNEEDLSAGDTIAGEMTVVKTEDNSEAKSDSLLRKGSHGKEKKEDPTRRELQDQARRLSQARHKDDALFHGGTDTEGEEESQSILNHVQFAAVKGEEDNDSVLRHLQFDSEGEGVMVRGESSTNTTSEGSSPKWQDVSFTGDETLKRDVKTEEPEQNTLAGEVRVKAEGQDASTSARLARNNSIRRRASNRSMKEHSTE